MPASLTALWQRKLGKNKVGMFALWLVGCLCQCNQTSVTRSCRDPATKVPETLDSDRLFGTAHLRSEGGSAWPPRSPCSSPEHPSLKDPCRTERELRCWASPQRQILVTITCVSVCKPAAHPTVYYSSYQVALQKSITTHGQTSHQEFQGLHLQNGRVN